MKLTKKMTGGEAIVHSVLANGVDTIFGLPGAQTYPIFDAIYQSADIKEIISRHEQGAGYMAFGYAYATGKPGVFSVVPGPGILNAGAALSTADATNTPILCLTGQVMSEFLGHGRGHLHEIRDQQGLLKSFIKHVDHIDDPTQTSKHINKAFQEMQSGRPGPASVEMCWDTMASKHDVDILSGNSFIEKPELNMDAINSAAKLISKSKKIMIMCGGGALHASEEVRNFAELLNAPVTSFRAGRGVVSEDHPCGISAAAARLLWEETDLLIGIGSRLEMQYMRWGPWEKYLDRPPVDSPKLIRIDIDPNEMERFIPDVAIVADTIDGVSALITEVEKVGHLTGDNDRISVAKKTANKIIREDIQPQMEYLDVIRDVLPRNGFFVEELCQVGFASNFGFPIYEPRTYVTTGYQGSLGFGFPTAIGVKVAMPDRPVVSIVGDGGFLFCMSELASAVQQNIGVITVVFNNSSYGNVRRDQERLYEGRLIGSDLDNPDMVKVAEAFGADAYRVNSPATLRPILEIAISNDRPAVIDVTIEKGTEASPWKYLVG